MPDRTRATRRHDPRVRAQLALYHEGRATKAPTAARVFDLYTDTARHHLTSRNGEIVQIFEPELNDLQHQVLDLLGIPADAYLSHSTGPGATPPHTSGTGEKNGHEKCGTRAVVSPAQPGGTRREVLGSDGLPGSER